MAARARPPAEDEEPEDERAEKAFSREVLEVEREEAQGVEVFEDPDATLAASRLKEGAPGHEMLTGEGVGLELEEEEREPLPEEAEYE